jgi:hypothetical protein
LLVRNAPDNCAVPRGALASFGHNLETGSSCNLAASGDLSLVTKPGLGKLADNGGDTQTEALLSGSPAVDAGGMACPATDQRGVARPQGAACDIGSFELAPRRADVTTTTLSTDRPAGHGLAGFGGFLGP